MILSVHAVWWTWLDWNLPFPALALVGTLISSYTLSCEGVHFWKISKILEKSGKFISQEEIGKEPTTFTIISKSQEISSIWYNASSVLSREHTRECTLHHGATLDIKANVCTYMRRLCSWSNIIGTGRNFIQSKNKKPAHRRGNRKDRKAVHHGSWTYTWKNYFLKVVRTYIHPSQIH